MRLSTIREPLKQRDLLVPVASSPDDGLGRSKLDSRDDIEASAWLGAFRTDDANKWKSVSLFNGDGGLAKRKQPWTRSSG
jgi:hypothetical protein